MASLIPDDAVGSPLKIILRGGTLMLGECNFVAAITLMTGLSVAPGKALSIHQHRHFTIAL